MFRACWPGLAPAGDSLSCSCKKVSKEHAPYSPCPLRCATGEPAVLADGVPPWNSLRAARCAQTTPASQSTKQARSDAPAPPACCAPRHGQKGVGEARAIAALGPQCAGAARRERGAERSDGPCRLPPPSAAPGAGRLWGGVCVGAHTLRDLTRRGCLSEAPQARSEFHGAPRRRTAPGLPLCAAQGSQTWGACSLLTFLHEQESESPAGASPGLRTQTKQPIKNNSCQRLMDKRWSQKAPKKGMK